MQLYVEEVIILETCFVSQPVTILMQDSTKKQRQNKCHYLKESIFSKNKNYDCFWFLKI
jgi:hypothetical protein